MGLHVIKGNPPLSEKSDNYTELWEKKLYLSKGEKKEKY